LLETRNKQYTTTLPAIMKKIPLQILIFVSLLMNVSCSGQEKILNHEFEPTASDFRITKWNLKQTETTEYYLTEKIDSQNRVTELKFYKNGKNNFDHLCYLQTWIKYEYPNDFTIIQTNLNNNGIAEANIECELASKVIYHLSQNKKIIVKTESEYKFDQEPYLKNGWTKKELLQTIKQLKENEQTSLMVDYFSKSSSKLNGIFPISSEFNLEEFYFSELEKDKILSGIN
tara:strand:+ start:9 stop:698 length:690 start_codon:yes stop_codon:yes gene_type:complete